MATIGPAQGSEHPTPLRRPLPPPEQTEVAGVVDRVTFHSEADGFCVLRVRIPGHRGTVTVVGHVADIRPGESVTAHGSWVRDRTHGLQFRAATLSTAVTSTRDRLETFLGSGLIPGIGPLFAKRLVTAFGDRVLDVIEHEPARLREVPGFGPDRARRVAEGWAEQRAARDAMLFLQDCGIGTYRAVRIYRTYGAATPDLVRTDPYRLVRDMSGFGFAEADGVATRLGIPADAPARIVAGIEHLLAEAAHDGHSARPRDGLLAAAQILLKLPRARIDAVLAEGVQAGLFVLTDVAGKRCVAPAELYEAERAIAARLSKLRAGPPPWNEEDAATALNSAERERGFALSPAQRTAVLSVLRTKAGVVTGGPGVGKTLLIEAVTRTLLRLGLRVMLTAPTGRAARILTTRTGVEARTLHRLLEFEPVSGRFRRNAEAPLDADLVVVDEMSMVDLRMTAALLDALPDEAAILMVGDADQLPSIGPGQVLADLIASGAVPTVRLTELFRQAAGSRIIRNAHRINQGEPPEPHEPGESSDFYVVPARSVEDAAAKVVEMVCHRIPARFGLDPVRDIQVLCAANEGGAGMRTLNHALQAVLNPGSGPEIARHGWTFRKGDRVLQVENDYDKGVANGDLGVVADIDRKAQSLSVTFGDRDVAYGFDELDQLALAYAMTVHKAQGSEYPAVIIPMTAQHLHMWTRNLLYTGVTRGRQLVVLVGDTAVLDKALATRPPARLSGLRERLLAPAQGDLDLSLAAE